MSLEIHAISTTASCQVTGGDGHLSAETDGRTWGYNGGRSQYFEGDTCYVIVYKSVNVDIVGSFCSNSSGWGPQTGKPCGFNLQRESISFSSPVASSSKPLPIDVKISGAGGTGYSYLQCGRPEYLPETTVIRMKDWAATLTPEAAPPYGFVFIEYTPSAIMWAFTALVKNVELLNTAVHGVIFAVASTTTTTFKALV